VQSLIEILESGVRMRFRGLSCAVLSAFLASAAQADEPAKPYAPLRMKFDPQGISLMDAVKLTLEQDPQIKLSDAQAVFKEGVAEQQAGPFDLTLNGQGSYQYVRSQVTDSVRASQQHQRDILDQEIPLVKSVVQGTEQALQNLANPNLLTNPASVDLTQGVQNQSIIDELKVVQSQLAIIQDLLNRTADPALRKDFASLRDQTIQTAIDRFTAQGKAVAGLPEKLEADRAAMGATPVDQYQKQAQVQLNVQKQLRWGPVLTPFFSLNYTSQNFVGKASTDPLMGGQGIADLYQGQLGFQVLVPLRRGLGRDDTGAPEKFAQMDHEATRLVALHQKSQSVLNTVEAYWNLRGASEQVEVSRRSVKLEGDLLNYTRELIKAKDRPRVDEARALASYADAEARFEGSMRQLSEAQVALAQAIGVALQDANSLPIPADPFPEPPASLVTDDPSVGRLVQRALGERFDRKAALIEEDGNTILAKGAGLETRRLVNLTGSYFGTATGESRFASLNRWVFKSGSGALQVTVPFKNNALEGQRMQAESGLSQASINAADLGRTIALNVIRLSQSLRLAANRLRLAKESVDNYDKTILAEQEKLKAGDSTLVDTILTEQQTTAARLAKVDAQNQYAQVLAQLRFEAGLLVLEARNESHVSGESLASVPPPLLGAPEKQ
jgi:outer membrane protein TolC